MAELARQMELRFGRRLKLDACGTSDVVRRSMDDLVRRVGTADVARTVLDAIRCHAAALEDKPVW